MNILFVCRYNRFRSRIAEAYFNKINKDKKIKAKSAGLMKGSPLSSITIKIAKELGLNIKGEVKGLSSEIMAWKDIIVIVADDVPQEVFNKKDKHVKEVIIWGIEDAKRDDTNKIKKLEKIIMDRTNNLNNNLKRRNENEHTFCL
jgi:protein-tyrosine-phosphatase